MGKSNAQRQREWRERQKLYNLEEYRQKELDRVNAYKKKQNSKTFKAKHRDATNRWRQNKREKEDNSTSNNPMLVDVTNMSRQSLGKAMKKVKSALPHSPRKKRAVVKALATSLDLLQHKNKTSNGLDSTTIDAVKEFYRREDIARFMPGKQDVITVWDDNGNKEKKQKRILTMTIGETYSLFVEEHPNISIGKSKFAELRPKEVLLSSKMPRNVCGCIYHENISLILQELHHLFPNTFPLYGKDFIDSCVCQSDSKVCMSSNCALCKDKFKSIFINDLQITDLRKESKWWQWEKNEEDGRTEKVEKQGSVQDLVNLLELKLKKFLYHSFINRQQTNAYNTCKNVCTEISSDTAMVQMDFSENFSCIYQDEVSSAHWKTTSVTLFTVMVWFRDQKVSMVFLSDNNTHDKTTVIPYSYNVFNMIKERFGPDAKNVEIWTDGPSSQFKNKFIFSYIGITLRNFFDFHVTWNYSATSHGKGAVDGIGGTVKRLATSALMTRKAVIKDAMSLYDAVKDKTEINLSVISDTDMKKILEKLDIESLWDATRVLPGTINVHCVKQTEIAEKVKVSHFKTDESYFVHPLMESSVESVTSEVPVKSFSVGEFVIVKYSGTYYPGEIVDVFDDAVRVRSMEKSGPKFWKWPAKEDILDYLLQDIVKAINPPTVVSNRGTFSIPELEFVSEI